MDILSDVDHTGNWYSHFIRMIYPPPQDSEIHNFAKSELLDKNVYF